ncbi:MAG: putative bifunctional diguanylate cyclase/phosphodiesterase [Planctomycetota bacterium]
MRIHHHISILHLVMIGGAIGLAVVVGLMMRYIENDAADVAASTEHLRRIEILLNDTAMVTETVRQLGDQVDRGSFGIVHGVSERWIKTLSALQDDPSYHRSPTLEAALDSLRRMAGQCQLIAGQTSDAELDPALVEIFLEDSAAYYDALLKLQQMSDAILVTGEAALTRQRRYSMLFIALFCIAYLALVEHTRYWTVRRLVRPVQQLADSAIQAMAGESEVPDLEQCGTEELNTLARTLSSFVETLKAKVRQRTAALERQKDHLEHEVSVRRRAEEQLRHAAFHDRLTGLCNRDLLLDRLDRCIARARRHDDYKFAVLFLDIDRFKEVNDSLGHSLGDQLLIAIAQRLERCLRTSDTLARVDSSTIARIGGDEFVIMLDGINDREDAGLVAERMQHALTEPFDLDGQQVFTSASIGIAFNELEYETPDRLLRDADAAMYYAKAAGKARHEVFTQRMHAEAMARLRLGNDLRRGVENGEFVTLYQPIVAIESDRIIGFEALVRWEHPERGLVSPIDFIEHAEETGLIVNLGQWVLRTACEQLRKWRDELGEDLPLTISVNVSKRQAADPSLVEEVKRVLSENRLPGHCLKLEITESVIMGNPDSIAEVLCRLRELGVEIHMDDFGTGYSSLSYLHRFPLDVLKIDREFLTVMNANHDYAGIVRTIVALAHELAMRVTVEGVETQTQYAALRTLHCDYAQGYFFSEPVDAAGAVQLLRDPPTWMEAAA